VVVFPPHNQLAWVPETTRLWALGDYTFPLLACEASDARSQAE